MSMISLNGRARGLFAISIAARLPLVMFGIAILVHAQYLSGSFASAGVVTGVYTAALGIGGPLLARLVDRRGQTAVLVISAAASAVLLVGIGLLPRGVPLPIVAALAAGIGLATPPVGACMRTLFPDLLPDARAVQAAYAVDASASELTWVAGPPLALLLGELWSTGAALAAGGLGLLVATAAFAARPASRAWRPRSAGQRPPGGSLRAPAMRTLVAVLVGVGTLFGATEVGITAAGQALAGSSAAAAPLLAVWGVGSLTGGLLAARFGGVPRTASGLSLVLVALTAGHLPLILAAGSLVALGGVLLIAGAAIAPAYAAVYSMIEDAAPEGTVTEAFAWLATAIAIGTSAGAAAGGALVEHSGPIAAFALAGSAGVAAWLIASVRSHTLPRPAAAIPEACCNV